MRRTHTMPFGARLLAGGGARFSLWAPAAQEAALWYRPTPHTAARTLPATRADGGWWQANAADAGAGTPYRWLIDGKLTVPDPASRSNPWGPHEPSVVTDPASHEWKTDWAGRPWNELVFYELHVGSFSPLGTYEGAIRKLPELAALGFTALELMPLAGFGGQWGWGYDGVLPFAPHAAYGSPQDLKRLVGEAHALGMCVFLDVVYNHFGPDGNYLHAYAPQFFSNSHASPWGAAINFDQEGSAVVRDFFVHNALYWIEEFGMDGLRLDAVHAIADDSRPDILQELSARVRELATASGRLVHLVLENEKNQPARLSSSTEPGLYDAQWNDDFHHAVHVALTEESQGYYAKFARHPLALLARVLTHGFAFPEAANVAGGDPVPLTCMVNFIGNHDQIGNRAFGERLGQLASAEGAELALLLALLTPATPMVFMGDEFAASTPFLYFANWDGGLRDAVREGRAREFGHAVTGDAVLPDPCDVATLQASRLQWDESDTATGQARRVLVQRSLETRRIWLQPRAQQLCTQGHTAEFVGESGLRVAWHYQDGAILRMEMNLGPDTVDATPSATAADIAAVEVFSHHWTGDERLWAPWSARWTCTEGLA
ncbi:malto-oligosyltrehalose trehalohydrolase [Acidovorax sp. LjRoot118]|uniref:malto-oligosyltrehalose trehalohydrolase n=1 Tax=Acidovorax sp. LjRoot118 TaxID=3342256 RepID=UPI003ECF8916